MLSRGDPAPWFEARSSLHPKSSFATRAGRYVVLCFFGSAAHAPSRRVLDEIERRHQRFDMLNACFCGVSVDPDDERLGRLRQQWPGILYFWDSDLAISRLYGAAIPGGSQYLVHTLILDPMLRVAAVVPLDDDTNLHLQRIFEVLDSLPPMTTLNLIAPVVALPAVFEPEFCKALIDYHDRQDTTEGGMLRDMGGQTVRVHDHGYKQRVDCNVLDPALLDAIQQRLRRRVFPEIKKAFQFQVTQIERYIVSCYDSQTGGHFRPHRDDTSKGAAHRRFAISINLNTDQYEGGELRFPEYGFRTYRIPTGGAIIFSCTLMHEVLPVTRGKRYAFLPFVYDDAAARLREANRALVAAELQEA